jgi:hypothetical protein
MAKQITDHIGLCAMCQIYQYCNTKESLRPHDIPVRPWQNIAADIFTLASTDYLVTVGHNSRYFNVDYLPKTQSISIII